MLKFAAFISTVSFFLPVNAQDQIFEEAEPRFIQAMKLERMGDVDLSLIHI